jgi:uncharacterized protein YggU (UPF0235/DUF167 family)
VIVGRLSVKVVPRASSTRLVGWLGDALKVAVIEAPEAGRANAAVCELLAQSLEVARSSVRCVSGHASSRKLIEIDGLTPAEIVARLRRLAACPQAPPTES